MSKFGRLNEEKHRSALSRFLSAFTSRVRISSGKMRSSEYLDSESQWRDILGQGPMKTLSVVNGSIATRTFFYSIVECMW